MQVADEFRKAIYFPFNMDFSIPPNSLIRYMYIDDVCRSLLIFKVRCRHGLPWSSMGPECQLSCGLALLF